MQPKNMMSIILSSLLKWDLIKKKKKLEFFFLIKKKTLCVVGRLKEQKQRNRWGKLSMDDGKSTDWKTRSCNDVTCVKATALFAK